MTYIYGITVGTQDGITWSIIVTDSSEIEYAKLPECKLPGRTVIREDIEDAPWVLAP